MLSYVSHFYQKVFIFSLWLIINVILIVTCIIYSKYWYIFVVPLSLSTSFNCLSVILIVLARIKNLFLSRRRVKRVSLVKEELGF